MNLIDKIRLKTDQIYTKTDQAMRNYGVEAGMLMGVASVLVGVGGAALTVMAATATAPLAAPLALAATAASATGSSFLGIPVMAAGSVLLNGGFAAIGFTALSKLYKDFKGGKVEDFVYGPQQLECVDKNGKSVKVDSIEVYKQIELGTFKENYSYLGINNQKDNTTKYHDAKDLNLESAVRKVEGPSLYEYDHYAQPIVHNIETIRRVLFKESKNYNEMADLSKKIKDFRKQCNDVKKLRGEYSRP